MNRDAGRDRAPPVRSLSPADLDLVAVLSAAGGDGTWTRDALASVLGAAGVWGLFAATGFGPDRRPAGFLLARSAADECEILGLVVEPAARRRGVGRSLLASAVERVAAAGGRALFLEVAVDNSPALGLYESFGFLEVGRRADYYKQDGRNSVDALIMRLALVKSEDH